MKIASWNIRGFGDENKKNMIKTLICKESIDIIGLIETKQSEIQQWMLKKCWGRTAFDFFQIDAIQNSGGLLLTWKQQAFDPAAHLPTKDGYVSLEISLSHKHSVPFV